VVGAVDQAAAAVAALDQDLTAAVLQRLVITISGCHRAGLGHSPELAASCQTVTIALHVDPRWV
jgi:hypothetical protein